MRHTRTTWSGSIDCATVSRTCDSLSTGGARERSAVSTVSPCLLTVVADGCCPPSDFPRAHVSRLAMLSLFTDKELQRWFESSGHDSPPLDVTDERRAARGQGFLS